MHAALLAMLKAKIYVRSVERFTDVGGEVLGEPREVRCYIERKVRMIAGPNGETRRTSHFLVTDQEIKLTDRIWLGNLDLTDTKLSKKPVQVDVLNQPASDLVDHYEVLL